MAEKKNIRSIRFSDEVIEIIEQQQGRNFTEKFDRLVYNCYMLQAEKEKELARIDDQIKRQREQLTNMRAKADKIKQEQDKISILSYSYHNAINNAIKSIEDM